MKKGKFIKTIAILCILCIAAMPLLSNASIDVSSKDICSTELTSAETAEVSGGFIFTLGTMLAILAIDAGLIAAMYGAYLAHSTSNSCGCGGCACGC